jgi:hypothetical protein
MTEREEIKLLPCPFCGFGGAQIAPNGIGDYFVICEDDDNDGCGARSSQVRCETQQHAAKRWNRRAVGEKTDKA